MNKKMAEHTGLLINLFFLCQQAITPLSKLFKVTLSECGINENINADDNAYR